MILIHSQGCYQVKLLLLITHKRILLTWAAAEQIFHLFLNGGEKRNERISAHIINVGGPATRFTAIKVFEEMWTLSTAFEY